jgi:hypothetical protein
MRARKKQIPISYLALITSLALVAPRGAQANENSPTGARSAVSANGKDAKGKLVVCFASKGEYKPSLSTQAGLRGLASLLHKYGYRGTYYLKPFTVEAAQAELIEWHKTNGDEVGWLSDGEPLGKAGEELKKMRDLLTGQTVRTAGHLRYGAPWVNFFAKNGVESVWGRCYEQSATDGITDRGCPFGFYYAKPDCFKVPNTENEGVISVPWLSNDLNLVFRTAQQSTFTFDPNDSQDLGVSTPEDDSFWRAEVNEYRKQTKYNKVVPIVIQQEIEEFDLSRNKKWREAGLTIFENLLKLLKEEAIEVVTVSEAVDIYKAAYPESTPPTYGVFGNIAATTPIIKNNKSLQPVTEAFALARKAQYKCFGPTFNGFYPAGRVERTWYYYDPKGTPLYEFGKNFSYYDKNGLLIFTEGESSPVRITPYCNLPKDAFQTAILPEMSHWFDTDKFIPKAEVKIVNTSKGMTVSAKATATKSLVCPAGSMPYGLMLWGDYSAYEVPPSAPVGTKILGTDGLFIPILLSIGQARQVELAFPKR